MSRKKSGPAIAGGRPEVQGTDRTTDDGRPGFAKELRPGAQTTDRTAGQAEDGRRKTDGGTERVVAHSAPPTPPDRSSPAEAGQAQNERTEDGQGQPIPEKYSRVKFNAKSRPDDEDNVVLAVNGEVLVIEREKEVVLPERYVDCARNAHYPQFRQLPGQPRKIVGKVLVYPFEILGVSTREEFLAQKKAGTDKLKAGLDKEMRDV